MNDIAAFKPQVLETACEWAAKDVADPAQWTEHLSPAEVEELDAAVQHAFSTSDDFLQIGKGEFPLPTPYKNTPGRTRLCGERPRCSTAGLFSACVIGGRTGSAASASANR